MRNLPILYKIGKEPILDPGATKHHQAGTGIWHCDTPRRAQKQHYKKVAEYKSNANWQGSRQNDVEAVNEAFDANGAEIKQKSLETIRLLRQADQALDKIREFIADCTEYV
jgi:predicted unusual protein kinase regulating ubiquinone biosynthesis (AarF/ABC1/UbiB family)